MSMIKAASSHFKRVFNQHWLSEFLLLKLHGNCTEIADAWCLFNDGLVQYWAKRFMEYLTRASCISFTTNTAKLQLCVHFF